MVVEGSTISKLQSQSVVRSGQATLDFSRYLQQNNFNQHLFRRTELETPAFANTYR
jgi:hypothetical protein